MTSFRRDGCRLDPGLVKLAHFWVPLLPKSDVIFLFYAPIFHLTLPTMQLSWLRFDCEVKLIVA